MSELRGEHVVLRPLDAADAPALREIHTKPPVAAWWGRMAEEFPFDEPRSTRFTVLARDRPVGLVQFGEEKEPDFRHAWIDLFLDPEVHNQGLGTDTVTTLARHLFEDRGHHRITIDPAADNAAAIRCYQKAGFRPVGLMRAAWRDPDGDWRDVLLMELVAERASR